MLDGVRLLANCTKVSFGKRKSLLWMLESVPRRVGCGKREPRDWRSLLNMRFLPDGPDVRDDLVAAQERGQTIFVCGAGVSKTADLPLFRELVVSVYAELGEDWDRHPAERKGMELGEYDRVLRCLERRLAPSDLPRQQGMRSCGLQLAETPPCA